jgi:hypothetical protein
MAKKTYFHVAEYVCKNDDDITVSGWKQKK